LPNGAGPSLDSLIEKRRSLKDSQSYSSIPWAFEWKPQSRDVVQVVTATGMHGQLSLMSRAFSRCGSNKRLVWRPSVNHIFRAGRCFSERTKPRRRAPGIACFHARKPLQRLTPDKKYEHDACVVQISGQTHSPNSNIRKVTSPRNYSEAHATIAMTSSYSQDGTVAVFVQMGIR
jgi:hypothetical protein